MDLRERLGLGTRSLKSAGSCSIAQFMASRPWGKREREREKTNKDEQRDKEKNGRGKREHFRSRC